jgi:hypothetical protein
VRQSRAGNVTIDWVRRLRTSKVSVGTLHVTYLSKLNTYILYRAGPTSLSIVFDTEGCHWNLTSRNA